MTKAETERMEQNRLHMLKIKKWFEFGISLEIVFAIYCSAALDVFGIPIAIATLIYIFLINRKDTGIIRKAIAGHVVAAVLVVGTAVYSCSQIFSGGSSDKLRGISGAVANGLTSVSPVATEELEEYEMISEDEETNSGMETAKGIVKVIVAVNLVCSVLITVSPIFVNAVLIKKCDEYYSMSDEPGFPLFITEIESYSAFRKEMNFRAAEHYKETYGVTDSVYSRERNEFENNTSEYEDNYDSQESHESSYAKEFITAEEVSQIKGVFAGFRDQITKEPENIYDYTVLSSFVVFIIGFLGLHVSSLLFSVLEVVILLFAMLPKNLTFIYFACGIHVFEAIDIFGGGIAKDGVAGKIIFAFMLIISVVQTIMYFMSAKMIKDERDAEFERQRQMRKAKYEEERERKIREADEKFRQDIERRKVAAAQNAGMIPAVPYAEPSSGASVPGQNYSSWSKVDTDLASSMLSDLNE